MPRFDLRSKMYSMPSYSRSEPQIVARTGEIWEDHLINIAYSRFSPAGLAWLLFALVLAFTSVPSNAQETEHEAVRESELTGHLMLDCLGRGKHHENGQLLCGAYFEGIRDLNRLVGDVIGERQFFCPKESKISGGEMREVFIEWTQDHPESLNNPGRVSALRALMHAYPCPE